MTDLIMINTISVMVIIWAIRIIYAHQQLKRARQRGLWPPLGQIPTDEDMKRLARAGEKILAIRMCRQIHNLDLVEAKAVVEKLAEPSAGGNAASPRASA